MDRVVPMHKVPDQPSRLCAVLDTYNMLLSRILAIRTSDIRCVVTGDEQHANTYRATLVIDTCGTPISVHCECIPSILEGRSIEARTLTLRACAPISMYVSVRAC